MMEDPIGFLRGLAWSMGILLFIVAVVALGFGGGKKK